MGRKIFIGLTAIILLDLGWTYYVTDGSLTFRQYLRNSDKLEAEKEKMLIQEELKVIPFGDSIKVGDFEIWRDKFLVSYQIGVSPFHYTKENYSKAVVNIRPLKNTDQWLISFDNKKELLDFGHRQDYVNDKNDSTTIHFYFSHSGQITPIGQLLIIPN